MPRYKPWLKMWVEWLGDPKMDSLSLAEQAAWWRVVSLAHQCANDGALTEGELPMSLEAIMKTLKVTEEADKAAFQSMLEKMTMRKSIHHNDNTLIITNYKRRQEMMPSNLPDAVAQRQRKHRKTLKGETESNEKFVTGVSPLESSKDTPLIDKDIDTERQRQRNARDVTTQMSQKGRDVVIAELAHLYEEFIGVMNPHAADQLRDFCNAYEGEVSWLRKAFVAAGEKRRWPYIRAILDRWQEEGGPHERKGQRRDDAAAGDSSEILRRKGWKVNVSEPEPAADQG